MMTSQKKAMESSTMKTSAMDNQTQKEHETQTNFLDKIPPKKLFRK